MGNGGGVSAAARLRPHKNSQAAAHIGKRPGTRPTPQRPRRNAEESTWQRAARAEKEETRQEKQLRPEAMQRPRQSELRQQKYQQGFQLLSVYSVLRPLCSLC